MSWTLSVSSTLFCLAAGALIGAVYFGGLWLTVTKMRTATHFYRLMIFSWLCRTALLLGGFYVVMAGDWQRLVSAFAGVLAVRYGMSGYLKKPSVSTQKDKEEKKEGKNDGKL